MPLVTILFPTTMATGDMRSDHEENELGIPALHFTRRVLVSTIQVRDCPMGGVGEVVGGEHMERGTRNTAFDDRGAEVRWTFIRWI